MKKKIKNIVGYANMNKAIVFLDEIIHPSNKLKPIVLEDGFVFKLPYGFDEEQAKNLKIVMAATEEKEENESKKTS